jgi:4-alpha-glucanotransferase
VRKFGTGCPCCGGSYKECNREQNALRRFADWDDLAAHCDEETIVNWVNELAASRKERVRAAAGFFESSE